jgi:hypothetical protein
MLFLSISMDKPGVLLTPAVPGRFSRDATSPCGKGGMAYYITRVPLAHSGVRVKFGV